MKSKGVLLILALLALLLAALAWIWKQRQEIASLQDIVDDDARRLAAHATERAELEQKVKRAQASAAQTNAPAVRPAKAEKVALRAAAVVPAAGDSTDVTGDLAKQWLADANDPAALRRLNLQARAQTQRRYSELFQQLHLSPDQSEALTKLLIDKRLVAVDMTVAQVQQNQNPMSDLASFQDMVGAARTGIEGRIQELLGEQGYADYRDYDRNFSQNSNLAQIDDALRNSASALSDDQRDRLRQLLQDNNAARLNPKLINQTNDFLSPAQVQALQDLRQAQQLASQKRSQPQNLPPIGSDAAPTKGN
jgi:hypothetical protein